jgi:hypothetical protein
VPLRLSDTTEGRLNGDSAQIVGQPMVAAAGFQPALSECEHSQHRPKSRLLKWTPMSISLVGRPGSGPVPPLERRLRARLPAPQLIRAALG